MSVMYIVLPLALIFAGLAVWAFIWAVRHGQLDDLQTPAARVLFDGEDEHPEARRARQQNQAEPESQSHDDEKPA